MSRNAFPALEREYNEREERLDEARASLQRFHEERTGLVVMPHGWRFRVDRECGRGVSETVAVFKTLAEARAYVRSA